MTLFSNSLKLTGRVLKLQGPGLFILFVTGACVSLLLEDQLALVSSRDDSSRILLALTGGVADLIEGLLLLFLVSWSIPRAAATWTNPAFLREPFKRTYVSTFFAEYLRLLGRVLLWGLLLIVPGFIRYIQLTFVPLIVFFSRKYEDGEVDALELSTQMANRRWKIVYPVLIFSIVISILLQLAPNHFAELHTLPIRVGFYLLGLLLAIWTYCLIFLVFDEEIRK